MISSTGGYHFYTCLDSRIVVHHWLPSAIANYFTINSAVHLYNTRVREYLHLDSVSTK